ncbi:MAG TPA: hypothetical protein VF532_19040 [Candidatus Angelobacter sp.]
MSTSQVLDRTISLYRSNFVLFAGIALLTPALGLVAQLTQLAVLGQPVVPEPGKFDPLIMQQYFLQVIISVGVGIVVYMIGTAFATSATIYAVSMVHLGKTTTIQESYRTVRPYFWRLLGLLIRVFFLAFWPIIAGYVMIFVMGFMIAASGRNPNSGIAIVAGIVVLLAVGVFLFGIPWLIVSLCRYALSVTACTLEKLPAKYSVVRSKFLSKGRKGGIFLIYFLYFLLSIALTYGLQLPALLANKIPWFSAGAHISIGSLVWIYVANFLGATIAGPLATIAIALVYYDQRVRKEAFDLQLMMEAVGVAQPTQAHAQAAPSLG